MEIPQTKEFYDFGAFRLDVKNRLLWRDGETIRLNLKEFEVLLFLVERAGQVVEKNLLLDAVWKDTFIEEGTLTQTLSRLRKKLRATSEVNDKYIETLPKRGYRFLPDVTVVEPSKNAPISVTERTLTHIRIEESIEIPDVETDAMAAANNSAPIELEPRRINIAPIPPAKQLPTAAPRRKISSLWIFVGLFIAAVVSFVVYLKYFRENNPKALLVSSVKPFSGLTGLENYPSFSPDGKQIAYGWNGGDEAGNDNSDIYVRNIGAVEPLRLTTDKHHEVYPVFSPDGSHIAFVRDFGIYGEVMLIPALGGAERRIARLFSGTYSISFAPDGKSLAVIDTEDSTGGENKQFAVYLFNLQSGERRRLTAASEFFGETTPRFAPDGKSLAFVRISSDGSQDLYVVPTDENAVETEPRRITFDSKTIHSLTWSGDGQFIFFLSFRGNNQPNVWRVSALGGDFQLLSFGGRDVTNIASSPDGKYLAFVENGRDTDIWRLTGEESAKKFISSSFIESTPTFSPDESRIAFESNRSGRDAIWIADADGKNLRMIADSPQALTSPGFSPDGSKIIYHGAKYDESPDGNSDIYVIPVENNALPRRLTINAALDELPIWSADGEWIYFISNRTGDKQVWKIPANGETPFAEAVQITRRGAAQAMSAPDGKTIFFVRTIGGSEMWRVSTDGGAEELLPDFAAAGFMGEWTVTKTGIYFFARENDRFFKIKFYDFTDKKIKDTNFFDNRMSDRIYNNFDITESGDAFIYGLLERVGSTIMIAEFGK